MRDLRLTPGKKAGFESLFVAVVRDVELRPYGSVAFGFNYEERRLLHERAAADRPRESRLAEISSDDFAAYFLSQML